MIMTRDSILEKDKLYIKVETAYLKARGITGRGDISVMSEWRVVKELAKLWNDGFLETDLIDISPIALDESLNKILVNMFIVEVQNHIREYTTNVPEDSDFYFNFMDSRWDGGDSDKIEKINDKWFR